MDLERVPFETQLKKAIKARNMTQKQLCEELGVPASTLSQYLTGKRTPNLEMIVALATALDVSTDFLLGRSSVMQQDPAPLDAIKKFRFRDSTIRFFEELISSSEKGNTEEASYDSDSHVDKRYWEYLKYEDWCYLRGVRPTADVNGFFYDLFEHPKTANVCNHIFYYQYAQSFMRLLKDRFVAYNEVFSSDERAYADCAWDSNSARLAAYESPSDFDLKFGLRDYKLFKERESFHVDGIPRVYGDKAFIYRSKIKEDLCAIVDDCCDKFEASHEEYFQKAKSDFIAMIQSQSAYHKSMNEDS